jgi:hypothetical protein
MPRRHEPEHRRGLRRAVHVLDGLRPRHLHRRCGRGLPDRRSPAWRAAPP